MVDQANIPDIFGICLYPTGGSITLGGYDRRSMKSKMMWAPMVQRYPPTFYTVPLPGSLNINGSEVSIPRFRSAIVDSGTTLIVMAQVSFNAIVQHLKMNYCNVPGLCASNSWFQPAACVNIGQKDLNKLPTLTFDVGNDVGLELRPEDYMLAYMVSVSASIISKNTIPLQSGSFPTHGSSSRTNLQVAGQQYRCVGIAAIDNISEVDVILGNTLNMRYVTIYDRENKRMGFAERRANCGEFSACPNLTGRCTETTCLVLRSPTVCISIWLIFRGRCLVPSHIVLTSTYLTLTSLSCLRLQVLW